MRPDQPEIIMREAEVCRARGTGRSSLWDDVRAGTFPKPIRLGRRAVGWLASEVAEWQRQRVADRDKAA